MASRFNVVSRRVVMVAAALAVALVARPLTVFACAWPDRRARWSVREMLFMCWTRETGVIPAALMTIAALEQLITDGIDRALALQSVLDATQDADAADITENDQPAGLPPPQFLRG